MSNIIKKLSLIMIMISSLGIVISQAIILFKEYSIFMKNMSAISFIGLGVGAILLGVWQLVNRK